MTSNTGSMTAPLVADPSPDVAALRETIALPEGVAGRSIVLVGLMGAGKTSIGRRLAARLGLPFRDTDSEVELAAGCSIAELFARYGEREFREGERRVIRRLLAGDPLVLATGGGAFMDPATRAAIRADAVSVWLRVRLPTLVRRVSGRTHRPLLSEGDPAEIMRRLMAQRHPTYAEADVIVDCRPCSRACRRPGSRPATSQCHRAKSPRTSRRSSGWCRGCWMPGSSGERRSSRWAVA
jgi:shikimate kinase